MSKTKIQEAQERYIQELKKVQSSAEQWRDFLDFAAKLQISDSQAEYEFATKLSIYQQNPTATNCQLFGDWKKEDNNHVKRYEEGIPVLCRDNNGQQKVSYLFDTSQTAIPKEYERAVITANNRENVENALTGNFGTEKTSPEKMIKQIAYDYAEKTGYNPEIKMLISETMEYKICKQFGLETDENPQRFSGIEKLSIRDAATVGIELNKFGNDISKVITTAINERNVENERSNNNQSRDDRTELHGQQWSGMDLELGSTGTRNEIPLQSRTNLVEQTEHRELDIRTDVGNAEAEANSGNGQVWQSATGVRMADTMPVGDTADREHSEALRRNAGQGTGYDRQDSREEETVGGIQGSGSFREVSTEASDVGEIQNGSGGGNTSSDGIRNINEETAEPEKVSAVSVCYDKLKEAVISDNRIKNAAENSDIENLKIEIENIMSEKALEIFMSDIQSNKEFFNDFFKKPDSEQHKTVQEEILTECSRQHILQKDTEELNRLDEADEKYFLSEDILKQFAKSSLAWDEVEGIGLWLYDKDYYKKHKPSEKAIYGNGLKEASLAELANKMHNGEDISSELVTSLMNGNYTFDIRNPETRKYIDDILKEDTDNGVRFSVGTLSRDFSNEELGTHLLKLIKDEYVEIYGEIQEEIKPEHAAAKEENKQLNLFEDNTAIKEDSAVVMPDSSSLIFIDAEKASDFKESNPDKNVYSVDILSTQPNAIMKSVEDIQESEDFMAVDKSEWNSHLEKRYSDIDFSDISNLPTVTVEWSENSSLEDGKTYSIAEFDRIMNELDSEYVRKKAETKNFEYSDDPVEQEEYYRWLGYDKTSFTINMPNGDTYTERQDIGDGDGGMLNFLRQYPKYEVIADVLEKTIAAERTEKQTEQSIDVFSDINTAEIRENLEKAGIVGGKVVDEENIQHEQAAPQKAKPQYFTITDEHLGEGGKKTKFQNNIEAIKTLKMLEEQERAATPDEQETLSKYVGWGGIQEAFDNRIPEWNAEYYTLKNLLSEEEYEAARSTVGDAFYTSPIVTKAIYDVLDNIGFKGGEILEPSMGIGNFFGTMPESMRENSNLSGVEIDSISGRIAQKLYPEANIAINGYENLKINKSTFDVAVGNVPFGNFSLNDKTKAYKGLMIHDYFFAKSLDSVRSGGIVAFVTSTGTLDKKDNTVRKMLAQKAELLGAIRLPDTAFQKNAGTPTTTDIIFLKKRDSELKLSDMSHDKACDWVNSIENKDGLTVNSYFDSNPQMVLGTLEANFRGNTVCKATPETDLKEMLAKAVKNIKGSYEPLAFQEELNEKAVEQYLPATPDIENLTYTVQNDRLYFRVNDDLIPLKESEQHGKTADRRKAMCGLAETVRELLQAQVEDRPDSEIEKLQAKLNKDYDSFVKKYDRINIQEIYDPNKSGMTRKGANSGCFKSDVRLPLLQSLEKMDEGRFKEKAAIFTERTIRPHIPVEHVETSHEALILSISEKGRIDFDYMQKLTGFEENKIIEDLKGDIYPVPELSSEEKTIYQTKDEYLSGNIYKKIDEAESRMSENPLYAENISALKEVIPPPVKATEIDMQLGMTWIDPKIIQQFMYETFETPSRFKEYPESSLTKNSSAITVEFSSAGKGSWNVNNAKFDRTSKAYGTKDYTAYEILENVLNGKAITVTEPQKDPETGKTRYVIQEGRTRAAEDKAKAIKNAFQKWIFQDPERRQNLVSEYNRRFNCIRPREYDGSSLNFYGSNASIQLKPHQKNAVAHALFGGNTLFAHQVGFGKTFEMVATAMEGKRLGLHNKSMFVVPNHLTEQIGSDFMKLYPNANILVAKSDDFSPQKRRQMCARIATGNFDAVIIGHSQLMKIPLSPEREQAFIKNQISEITSSLEAAKAADGASYTIKQMEATKKKLSERLDKLINSSVKDSTVTFEELGVDKLFVDEAHEFKNLYVATKMENVSGLSTNADVQKTQDLYMKCQYLDEKTGSKGVVFSTGTPVTNALSEMFTTMKYLQSDMLKDMGLDSFDSWAGNFTRKSTEAEIQPNGTGWRMKTRLKFTNVPELQTMFKECADVKMSDQIKLDVPECDKIIVSVEPTEAQKAAVEALDERSEKIQNGSVSRTDDNMLCVIGDGRKLGLDQRLYDPNLNDEPQTKVNACVQNVFDIWEKTADKKSTQLIFSDLGVSQSKEDRKKNGERFDVYNDIKGKLIEKGVPEKEIAFIHDAKSEVDKARLFASVRSGDVRILIGSTQKMGAGTNVQTKLVASHDLDCPWRPADLTQRLGRMVRQGNENDKVQSFRYVTKGTLDAYLYQMVEKKQTEISRIFTSKNINRTYDDIDDIAADLKNVKISALGDERVRRQMELQSEIRELKMLEKFHKENQYEMEDKIQKLPKQIEAAEKRAVNISADIEAVKNCVIPQDNFELKVGNRLYDNRKEAGEALLEAIKDTSVKNLKKSVKVAEYKGFDVEASYDAFSREYVGKVKGNSEYNLTFGTSESGNITRLDNTISSISNRLDMVCDDIEMMKSELRSCKEQVNIPFEHADELKEKCDEFERLKTEIENEKINQSAEKATPEEMSEKPTPEPIQPTAQEATQEPKQEPTSKPTEQATSNEKSIPKCAIRWSQNDTAINIEYNGNAEKSVVCYVNGKESGHCTPEELDVTDVKGNYPKPITKCIEPLNIAFSDKAAEKVREFVADVKQRHSKTATRTETLFSKAEIMTEKYTPVSGKINNTNTQEQTM